jgi:DNA-binding response OmpR family regulator
MTLLSETPQAASDFRPPGILVVEDDPLLRLVLASELRQAGFRVCEAANAAEAETLLASDARIDLVITDIEMPGERDGLALARLVRAQAPNVRVIVVSGTLPEEGIVGVADAYFGKPYDPERLIERARTLAAAESRPGNLKSDD